MPRARHSERQRWARLRRLSYADVVSTLCLFLLLGGGAYAASGQLSRNSVGPRQLRRNAVTGAKVKDGSLTGADVRSSTLGQVPQAAHAASADTATRADTVAHADSAAHADTAGDAATLGGLRAADLYPAGGISRLDYTANRGDPFKTILDRDGLVLNATCSEGGIPSSTVLNVDAISGQPGARISTQLTEHTGSEDTVRAEEFDLAESQVLEIQVAFVGSGSAGSLGVGSFVYQDQNRALLITVEMRATSSHTCQLSGSATVSG